MSNARIDRTILTVAKPGWLKIAKVIGDVASIEKGHVVDNDQVLQAISGRIKSLVYEGRLIAQGDISKPRHSEVRLPGPLVTKPVTARVRHLRVLDGIKHVWAGQNNKSPNELPTWADLRPYLRRKPRCPQGGTYTLWRVDEPPRCSYDRSHSLPP